MGLNFETVNARITSGGAAASGPNSLASSWQLTLKLQAYNDNVGNAWTQVNSSIDENDVMEWLRRERDRSVNNVIAVRNKWDWATQSDLMMVLPWHVLSNVTIVRSSENAKIFDAALTYSVPSSFTITQEDLEWIACPQLIDDYPWLEETIFVEDTQMIWNKNKVGPPERLTLPSGNQFSEPFYKKAPRRVHRQRQYEPVSASDIETIIEERLFTLCDIAFKNDAPDPPRWMCTDVDFQPMKIPVFGGGILTYDSGYLMTYTLERSNKTKGWLDERALIDTHYLETANDKNTIEMFKFPDGSQAITTGLVNQDGTAKGDQNGTVELVGYEVQPVGNWNWLKQ